MGRLARGCGRRQAHRASADRSPWPAPASPPPFCRGVRVRRGRTERIVKVTLPSPSLFANFYDPERSRGTYPTLESFLADVAEILREEVDELVRLGCEYVQLDAPHYPPLLDSAYRDFYESRGWPAERWLGRDLDNIVFGEHPGVAFDFHLCRGNQQSRWLVEGGYDWLAQRLFPRVRAQRLLLEYDDEEAKLRTIVATAERLWG